jgi:NADH dehydrogenase
VPEPGGLLTRPNDVGVHRALLTGFKNRLAALFNWTVAFLGRGRWQRVITAQQVFARRALEQQATVMPKVHAVEVGDEPRRV